MMRMTLIEYSDDLVLAGEVEFGGSDDACRALSGSVMAGAEAHGALQEVASGSEGSVGIEPSHGSCWADASRAISEST